MCERTSFFLFGLFSEDCCQHTSICMYVLIQYYGYIYYTIPYLMSQVLCFQYVIRQVNILETKTPKTSIPSIEKERVEVFSGITARKKMCEITQYFSSISYTILYMYIYLKICCSCICENTFSCICIYVYSSKFCQKRYKKT